MVPRAPHVRPHAPRRHRGRESLWVGPSQTPPNTSGDQFQAFRGNRDQSAPLEVQVAGRPEVRRIQGTRLTLGFFHPVTQVPHSRARRKQEQNPSLPEPQPQERDGLVPSSQHPSSSKSLRSGHKELKSVPPLGPGSTGATCLGKKRSLVVWAPLSVPLAEAAGCCPSERKPSGVGSPHRTWKPPPPPRPSRPRSLAWPEQRGGPGKGWQFVPSGSPELQLPEERERRAGWG